jgi:guanylate kinase
MRIVADTTYPRMLSGKRRGTLHCMVNSGHDGRGLLLVISGPSGVGKTTVVRDVEQRLGGCFSVSATTRPKGPNEVHGRDYFFVSEDEFQRMIERGELLEHACVFGRHHYGTPRKLVEECMAEGKMVILDIDVQGAQQVKRAMPEAFAVFILPPGEEELLRRLRERRRDDEQAIQRRLAEARSEIEFAQTSGCYDAFVVNDDLDEAIERACALIVERLAEPRSAARRG